jgi:hypothetical protein
MKPRRWIGAAALLTLAASWKGAAFMSSPRPNPGSEPGPVPAVVRLAAAESAVELQPSIFEARTSQTWTLPREGTGALQVQIANGQIRVLAGEGDQIRIEGIQQARAGSEAEARALLEPLSLERHRDGDRWIVEGNWPLKAGHRQRGDCDGEAREVTLEIHLPAEMQLEAQNQFGGIDVTGIPNARLRLPRAQPGGILLPAVRSRRECPPPFQCEPRRGSHHLFRLAPRSVARPRSGGPG